MLLACPASRYDESAALNMTWPIRIAVWRQGPGWAHCQDFWTSYFMANVFVVLLLPFH